MGGVDDPYIAADADDCADESDVAALVLQHSLPLIMLKESTMTVTIAIRANRKRGNEQYLRCIGPVRVTRTNGRLETCACRSWWVPNERRGERMARMARMRCDGPDERRALMLQLF